MKGFIISMLVFIPLVILTVLIVKTVHLDQNCTGHLKRAAGANTVELALKELNQAVAYCESNNLTKGYTSVFYNTPDEDIEFWYNNLKASQAELESVTPETTSLEKTNILMKLRETLTDQGEKGAKITYPDGLSRYPDNGMWMFLGLLSIAMIITVIIYGVIELD